VSGAVIQGRVRQSADFTGGPAGLDPATKPLWAAG